MGDKGVSDQEFCLPSEFLNEIILMDKENMYKDKLNSLLPRTYVPTESPTESLSYFSNNNYLVPPFPAGPKIPEKTWPMASLTQPILSPVVGNGGSLVPSPPITPIGRNIHHFQVKNMNSQGQNRNFTPTNPSNVLPSVPNGIVWGGNQQAGGIFGNGGPGMAWGGPHVQNPRRSYGGVDVMAVGYGGGIKRERAGTGVFLPRRYHNTTPVSRKKTGGSTTQPPPRRAVQAQNKKFENATPQLQSQRHVVGRGHSSENELATARRDDAALAQEGRETTTSNPATTTTAEGVNDEIRLPQEWTY